MLRINQLLLLVAVTITLQSCGPDYPATQNDFVESIGVIQYEYNEFEGNDMRQNSCADSLKNLIKNYGNFKDWIGEVEEINQTLGSSWVSVKFENSQNVELKLWPEGDWLTNEPMEIFNSLKPGMTIKFSGKIKNEISLTNWGMMENPEITINPSEITVVSED